MSLDVIRTSQNGKSPPLSNKGVGWKDMLHKNVVEQLECRRRTRGLEKESRSRQQHLNMEEKMLKGQLERLQQEQRELAESLTDVTSVTMVSETASEWDEDDLIFQPDEEEFVNPYPVTIQPARKSSAASRIIMHDKDRSKRKWFQRQSHKRPSVEFEDIDFASRNISSREHSFCLPSLSRCDSAISMQTPGSSCVENLWVGEPEAIGSIRRGLKPSGHKKVLNRSLSMKEQCRPCDSLSSAMTALDLGSRRTSPRNSSESLSRHHSLKEKKVHKETPSSTSTRLFRSKHLSLKEKKQLSREGKEVTLSPGDSPLNTTPIGSPPISQNLLRRRRLRTLHYRSGSQGQEGQDTHGPMSVSSTPDASPSPALPGAISDSSSTDQNSTLSAIPVVRKNSKRKT